MDGTLTIAPAGVILTANGGTETYDGTEKTVTGFTPSVPGLAFAGVSASGSGTNVGDYPATFTGLTLDVTRDTTGNYVVTNSVDGTLTVMPRPVTVTADSGSKDYDGTPLVVSGFTAEGLLPGDTLTVAMTAESTITDVGMRPNVIGTVDGVTVTTGVATDIGNYSVTTVDGTLAIMKIALTIIANDAGKTYGEELAFGGTEFTTVPAALPNGEHVSSVSITSAMAADASTAVGIYVDEIAPFYPVQGIDTNNYDIVFSNGTLTVTQAVLTITVNDSVWKVGKPRPDYSFADFSDQLKAGDTVADVTGGTGLATDVDYSNVVWSVSLPTVLDAGTYANEIWLDAASLNGARAANYSIVTIPGALTIKAGEADLKTSISATLNWNTGLLDLELTVLNAGDGEVDPDCDYWVELKPGEPGSEENVSVDRTFYIDSPTGTLLSDSDYVDLTSKVKTSLLSIGNGDAVFDPGETVVLGGVSIYHWKRWTPEKFINPDTFFAVGNLSARVKEVYALRGTASAATLDVRNAVAPVENTAVATQMSNADVVDFGDFTASSAATYTGWLRNGDGRLVALIKVTTTAAKKPGKRSKSVITVKPFDGSRKRTYRTSILPGGNPTDEFGVTYGNLGLSGEMEGCAVFAGRDLAKAKAGTPERDLLKSIPKGAWMLAVDAGGMYVSTVNVGKNGKAKIKGTFSNGKRALLSAQGVFVAGRDFAIPVMNAKKGTGYVLWIDAGGAAEVSDAVVVEGAAGSAKKRK